MDAKQGVISIVIIAIATTQPPSQRLTAPSVGNTFVHSCDIVAPTYTMADSGDPPWFDKSKENYFWSKSLAKNVGPT
jgi:hypothetical protein